MTLPIVKTPTVIVVTDTPERKHAVYLARGPIADDQADVQYTFPLSPGDILRELDQAPARIREVGERLFTALGKQPAVQRALQQALDSRYQPGAKEVAIYPIYVSCSQLAEQFPWETLWVDEQRAFIALYLETVPDSEGVPEMVPVWPLARMTAPVDAAQKLDRVVQPYLKVSAVISAAGVPGEAEWNELHTALVPLGNRVRVQVFVGDDRLKRHIEANSKITTVVEFVGDRNLSYLYSKVQAFGPNLLHFLCHGSNVDGPHLEIATRSDWKRERATGSMLVQARELVKFGQIQSVWLVTLNCCQSANASGGVRSIARTLVEAGTPAVLAMREPITPNNASLLTKEFYARLARELSPFLATQGDEEQTIPHDVWPRALQRARHALFEAAAAAGNKPASVAAGLNSEWTLPVLYLHKGELVLQPRPAVRAALTEVERANHRAQINTLRHALDTLDPERDKATVREIVKKIRDLEDSLYASSLG